ncbi:MAG: DUF1735 domain-containing protein, partial [Dysgonamonadaceae bacterium]|nr:DUF1735 domain-containing protein [Dysgonamonadaceae bacterium]
MQRSFINTIKKAFHLLPVIGFLLSLAAFTACEDAEYKIKENSVYISDAATSAKSAVVSLEASGADINVVVRIAKQTDQDVKVQLALDSTVLKQFNAANNTNYLPVPDACFHWVDSTVAIIR